MEHQQLIYSKVKTVKHLLHYISAVGFSQQIPMIGLLHLGYKNTPLYDCMISPTKRTHSMFNFIELVKVVGKISFRNKSLVFWYCYSAEGFMFLV